MSSSPSERPHRIDLVPRPRFAREHVGMRDPDEPFDGWLIRAWFPAPHGERWGVASVHPWPALGEPDAAQVKAELAALLAAPAAKPSSLVAQALRTAARDAEGRAHGRSLLGELRPWLPASHGLLPPLGESTVANVLDRLKELEPSGVHTIKAKVGHNLLLEAQHLDLIARAWPHLRLRLDANMRLDRGELAQLWSRLSPATRAAIEFIEDPLPWDPAQWAAAHAELGVAFAWDRGSEAIVEADELPPLAAIVHKPASQATAPLVAAAKARGIRQLVVTNSLGHALEAVHAAVVAAELAREHGPWVGVCGVASVDLDQPDPDGLDVARDGAAIVPPPGTGLGFDTALARLPWMPLAPAPIAHDRAVARTDG